VTSEPAVIELLGLQISDLDSSQAAELISRRDPALPFAYVVTPNAHHMVRLANGDIALRRAYETAWLRLCDGGVVRPLVRFLFDRRLPSASGSDVTLLLLQRHIRPDDPMTVIGGGARLEAALIARFGLRRLAIYDPPFGFIHDPDGVAICLKFLEEHPARYVFLAVGSPQSEILARQASERQTLRGVGMCIGGSLLFAAGLVKRAPIFLRRFGLEGAYRLVQRPRSHFRRVFIDSAPILWILLRARLGGPGILPPTPGRQAP
jgi:exopolysaccharide biosynthesis WecB/TagA/CpsF family protein